MRLARPFAAVVLLSAAGCGLNPQPEPPTTDTELSGAGGAAGGGGAGEGGGRAGAGVGGAAGSAGAPGVGGGHAGAGGASTAGAALPDSPTPYCTGEDGGEVTCPAAGSKTGEDGAFQGQISTFVDEGDRLRDTLTQLSWQKTPLGPLSPADATSATCPAGARAPSLLELLTLADFGRADGQLPPFGVGGSHFATVAAGTAALALPAGGSTHAPAGLGVLRCVSGPAFVVTFAVDAGGETVTSSLGLRFERQSAGAQVSWKAALDACAAKGGGARLPTVKELFTLVDDASSPTADAAFVAPSAGGQEFWSSTADPTGARAFVVSFASRDLKSEPREAPHQVRCVVP